MANPEIKIKQLEAHIQDLEDKLKAKDLAFALILGRCFEEYQHLSPELQKVLEVLVNDMLRDPSVLSGFAEIVEKILISPGSHQS